MDTNAHGERRRYRRYVVSGDVQLFRARFLGNAKLVQLGLGGMLLRGGVVLPAGTQARAIIKVADCPFVVEVPFEVVGLRNALMAVKFLSKPKSLSDLGQWLAERDHSLAPMLASEQLVRHMRCGTSIPRWSSPDDREAALEFAYAKTQCRTSPRR